MSALCQKQTFRAAAEMALFDHLVSDRKQAEWDRQTERLDSFKVDDEFEFDGFLSRQV
jgi:hypothetical protein